MVTKRETVQIADGRYIKAVRWVDGDNAGWKTKSVVLTSTVEQAATFLPEAAAALRKAYGPEAVRRAQLAERAAAAVLAEAFTQVCGNDPKLRELLAPVLKGLL